MSRGPRDHASREPLPAGALPGGVPALRVARASLRMLGKGLSELSWTVVSITGFEAVNELFRFEAVVTAPRDDIAALGAPLAFHQQLPKQDVWFTLGDPAAGVEVAGAAAAGSKRFAMIAAAHHRGIDHVGGEEVLRLGLELVPRAWLLTQRRNSRIFQDRYVHEIVSWILWENGIRHRWDLQKNYPRRLYCTQYQETDYEFVTRLLAEEGIFFHFRHEEEVDSIQRFQGGFPPRYKPEQSQTEKDLATAGEVIAGIGKGGQVLNTLAGTIASSAGEAGVAGGFGIAAAASGIVGDMATALMAEDEAPIIVPGNGQAGPEGGGDIFVFGDTAGIYPTALNEAGEALQVTVDASGGMAASELHRVETLGSSERSRPELVEIRDYDFRKPLMLLKENAGPYGEGTKHLVPLIRPADLMEQYEHHGEHETPDVAAETASIQLEQHRRDVASYEGKSRSPALRAGHVFELSDSARDEALELVVVRVHHEFHAQAGMGGVSQEARDEAIVKACARAIHDAVRAPELGEEQLRHMLRDVLAAPPAGHIEYQNFFTSVARDVPYRPARPPRVMRNVTESATVMGPVGQDIYTDRLGRVKVQFHWDREGKFDELSSVWMRVVQPWAGAGYGFQFFPRVGMEVLVTFIGGDPDRPVVLGSLYNGTHPTPEPLPERMSRSGIRTQSTPKGGGFNELSFEDAKGTERVYLHAERDFDAEINHSHGMKVKHAHTLEVGLRQHVGVEGEQLIAVGGMQATTVGADQASCVGGSRRERVVGNASARVEGNAVEEVRGVAVRKIDSDELTVVEGSRDVSVYGNATFYVEDRAMAVVNQGAALKGKTVGIVTKEGLTFRDGTSVIAIVDDKIILEAETIELRGRKLVDIVGDEVRARSTRGAIVNLKADDASIQGMKINLTTPERKGGWLDPEKYKPNVHLVLTHLGVKDWMPIANTRYVATQLQRASPPVEGTTGKKGQVSLYAEGIDEPIELTVFANETYSDIYPREAGPLRFIIHLEGPLGNGWPIKEARIRLRNLGYHPGTDLDDKAMDVATRQALLDFQLEAEIPRTGELDRKTQQKLRELYGK
jgi:type VI secretion system secreted protein VgrG